MAFFLQPQFAAREATSNPLFHFFEEIEKAANIASSNSSNNNNNNNYACGSTPRRQHTGRNHCRPQQQQVAPRTYSPRFDVRETDTTYELDGDLPGVLKENISIEFSEPQTVVIRGHNERSYTVASTEAATSTPAAAAAATTTTTQEDAQTLEKDNASTHQASVSDDEEEFEDLGATTKQKSSASDSTVTSMETPAPVTESKQQQPAPVEDKPNQKYWFSERAIGNFERSFNFPARVEQEGVKADLANGVLHVSIPKAKKHEVKRVTIL